MCKHNCQLIHPYSPRRGQWAKDMLLELRLNLCRPMDSFFLAFIVYIVVNELELTIGQTLLSCLMHSVSPSDVHLTLMCREVKWRASGTFFPHVQKRER